MENTGTLIKKIFLYLLFVVFVVLLLNTASKFAETQEYFSVSKQFSVYLIVYLFLSISVLSVISQTLIKKREILYPSILLYVISLIFLSRYRLQEALIGSSLIFLVSLYGVRRSYYLRENLLILKIRHSARTAVTGFLFAIGIYGAICSFLVSEHVASIDVGQRVADIAEKPIKDVVMQGYENEANSNLTEIQNRTTGTNNSQLLTVLNSLGVTNMLSDLTSEGKQEIKDTGNSISASIKSSIAKKVNDFLEPYRMFFSPTLAILVFGIFQIYAWIAYIFYAQLIGLVLLILKRTGYVKVEKIPAEQEILKF